MVLAGTVAMDPEAIVQSERVFSLKSWVTTLWGIG